MIAPFFFLSCSIIRALLPSGRGALYGLLFFLVSDMSFPTPNFSLAVLANSTLWLYENNPVLANLQIGVENDTGRFKLGDGTTAWNDLGYAALSQPTGVWVGKASTTGNLLQLNVLNGGFFVDPASFDGHGLVNQAVDGSLTDITPYLSANQHLAGFVAAGLLIRKVINALGANWPVTSTSGALSPTVTEMIATITNSLSTLSGTVSGLINDTAASATHTYSSTKIEQLVTAAIANLVGAAPAALDTVYELAAALGNNPSLITGIVTDLGNTVRFTLQALTGPQQVQARSNIGAAAASALGSEAENSSTLAAKYLADKTAASGTVLLSPSTIPAPIIKTAAFVAKPIGIDQEGIYGLDSTAGAFNVSMYGGPFTVGMIIQFIDKSRTLATNNVTLLPNGGKFMGVNDSYVLNRGGNGSRSFILLSLDWGWHPF